MAWIAQPFPSLVDPLASFPGKPSNPVGFVAAPGFSSLTPSSGPFTAGNTYSFLDIDAGTSGTLLTANNMTFIGCRFQSNQVANYNIRVTGSNTSFSYCSVTPRVSLATAPPNASWPAASAGKQQVGNGTGYQIDGNSGYQYGLQLDAIIGPVTLDHCDIWGFGNAITWLGTAFQTNVTQCWIHDAADAAAQGYHTDGPGYLNGGTPPSNITISKCTIASIGNTNAIAFQNATSGFSNISVINCYLSGFGDCVNMCNNTAGNSNLTFTGNYFGTDLPWVFAPLHNDYTTQFTGTTNKWRGNTLKVLRGTSPVGGASFSFTLADDGKYLLPNDTLSATDFTG